MPAAGAREKVARAERRPVGPRSFGALSGLAGEHAVALPSQERDGRWNSVAQGEVVVSGAVTCGYRIDQRPMTRQGNSWFTYEDARQLDRRRGW